MTHTNLIPTPWGKMTERLIEGMIEFFIPMVPPTVTHQEHKVRMVSGKPVFYDGPELKAARAKLTDYLIPHRPGKTFTGALELVVKWCFPISATHRDGEYRTSKPDTDNLQKLLKDCMTATGYWKDDALVCREIVEKFWAKIPGIYIRISELE